MLRKILLELILIRKELQRIQECTEPKSFDREEKNDQNQAGYTERMIIAAERPDDSDIYQKSAWFSVVTSSAAVVVAIMVLVMR